MVGAAAMGLNLVFSLAFSALFERIGWMPHGGLALANSLATALEMCGLLILMRRRLNGLNGRAILTGGGQAALATLAMALVLILWLNQTAGQPVWLVAGGGILAGGIAFGLVVLALGVQEAKSLVGEVVQRLKF